jgi:chemotaxis response regulator CheB
MSVRGGSPPKRVVVCDDSPELRALVVDALQRHPTLDVVALAGDAPTVLRLAGDVCPDVIVLDLLVPGAEPDALVTAVASAAPQAQIVVFSGLSLEALDEQARAAVTLHKDKTTPVDALAAEVAGLAGRRGHRVARPTR